ncbi:hypothetical protein HDU92_006018 [Lobulomyces angularis]|nr:hypothetical protein HDU92_006018 [Lobulomyces angularis]
MSKKATKVLSSTDDDELIKEPVKKKGKFNLMEISSPGSPKTVVEPDEMAGLLPEEIERRNKRRERFESENGVRERTQLRQIMINKKAKEAFIAAGAEGNPDVIDWDEDTIVGTCQKLDKSYLRLTSAPDPSTVRPLHILKETLEMLTSKWKSDSNYTYICDQFKSLRQDLTVQRIKNDFTVKVYESHARIALEKGDLGEFNQCQAQLKQLYELNIPGNVDEFTSYRILYAIYTLNKRDINQILTKLTSHQKAQKNIKHALLVRQSVTHNDYHKFFKLYQNAPDMSVYLLDFFVERQRIIAMKFITKAYKYTISIDFLVKELGFCRLEDNKKAFVKGKKKLRKFFEENSVSCESPAKELDCQVAHEVFAEIIKKFNKVDIKGQI